jgi:hypothetical protein
MLWFDLSEDHKDGLGGFLGLVMIAQVPQRGGIDEVNVSCDQGGKRLLGVRVTHDERHNDHAAERTPRT